MAYRYFTAGDLMKLVTQPMAGEADRAARLKAFLLQHAERGGGNEITVMKVGKRLATMLDTPVEYEGRTLKLSRKAQASRRAAAPYIVKVLA